MGFKTVLLMPTPVNNCNSAIVSEPLLLSNDKHTYFIQPCVGVKLVRIGACQAQIYPLLPCITIVRRIQEIGKFVIPRKRTDNPSANADKFVIDSLNKFILTSFFFSMGMKLDSLRRQIGSVNTWQTV